MENYHCKSVGIIGSGIQGVCIGLQLIKKKSDINSIKKLPIKKIKGKTIT